MRGNELSKKKKRKLDVSEDEGTKRLNFNKRCIAMHGRSSPERVIELLKAKFDHSNLQNFRTSCFGAYLGLPKLIHQGPLIYFLLRHLNVPTQQEGVLTFNIKGVEATFGPKEFLSITGLSFGPVIGVPSTSSFKDRMFGSNVKVFVKDIEKAFTSVCAISGGGGEEALKAGICLFAYGVLIGNGYSDHPIDTSYMNLCDDMSVLNSFPWGRISYEFFVSHFYTSRKTMYTQASNDESNISVDIFGFSLAIQVWAFEVFPEIRRMTCYSKLKNIPAVPRILGWSCVNKAKYKNFNDLIDCPLSFRKVEFRFSDEEDMEIWNYLPDNPLFIFGYPVENDDDLPSFLNVRPVKRKLMFSFRDADDEARALGNRPRIHFEVPNLFKDIAIPSSSCEVSPMTGSSFVGRSTHSIAAFSCNEASKSPDLFEVLKGSPEVKKKLEYVSAELSSTNTNYNESFSSLIYDGMAGSSVSHVKGDALFFDGSPRSLGGSFSDFDSSWIDEIYPSFAAVEKLFPLELEYSAATAPSDCYSSMMSRDPGDRATYAPKLDQKRPSSPDEVNSVCMTADRSVEGGPIHNEHATPPKVVKYSPMKRYPRDLLDKFLYWYRNAKDDMKYFTTPLLVLDKVDLDWIRLIYMPDKKLKDEQCDVLLNLLLLKATVAPDKFNNGWTCVESLFWNRCTQMLYVVAEPTLLNYVMGNYPRQFGVSWSDVVDIYGIAHLFNNHWAAYVIDMLEQKIVVYDSLSESNNWESVAEAFQPLCTAIPLLLERAKFLDPNFKWKSTVDTWPVVPCSEALVQQMNGNDCGILAVKYIECLSCDYPPALVDPGKCDKLRSYYCAQLYNAGR